MMNLAISRILCCSTALRRVVFVVMPLILMPLILMPLLTPLRSQSPAGLEVKGEIMSEEIKGLQDFVNKKEDIFAVSVSRLPNHSTDDFAIAASRESAVPQGIERLTEEEVALGPIRAIWLHPRHPGYGVFRYGPFEYRETDYAPPELFLFSQKLKEAQKSVKADKRLSIGDIAFSPTSGWIFLIIGGSNRYYQNGAPSTLVAAIEALKQGQTVNHVAIGADNAWVLVFDNFDYRKSDNLSPSMVGELERLKRSQKPIHALALHPVTTGWLVVSEK
jgi:hypothetical protein